MPITRFDIEDDVGDIGNPERMIRGSPSTDSLGGRQKIVFGICAMAKKTSGKPMREILKRLAKYNDFDIVVFDEEMILNAPVEEWPPCDALLSWFSTGFPLQKAVDYADLRRPYLINDLRAQFTLQDRREVFRKCAEFGIPLPRHAFVNRDDCNWKTASEELEGESVLEEEEDSVTINGIPFAKPFVEKPVSGEDHNIYIYYPKSAGGGIKKLFRKTDDKSSEYCKDEWAIRREGSFIYEDFLPTEGVDVKVYAVGHEYAHAEARKAPTLDGKVQRDHGGNEVRYPVVLSYEEKVIANKIVSAFGQFICGFDVLRSLAGSFVCDVNGFSFVKKSKKYYDDTVFVVRTKVISALVSADQIKFVSGGMPTLALEEEEDEETSADDDLAQVCGPGATHSRFELRCVMAVVRHGDRTPKQKMKLKLTNKEPAGAAFLQLFQRLGHPGSHRELKLKQATELQSLLDTTNELLSAQGWEAEEGSEGEENAKPMTEQQRKMLQMKSVLERWGSFSGINRKAQIKPTKWEVSQDGTETVVAGLLVMKWGGELTENGMAQAEDLGRWARETLYMGESAGLLRLHASYRHDLKIYSSDEGRVQMTAAAFSKGFLDLEGELPPILVGLVRRDGINALLDETEPAERDLESTKATLYPLVNSDQPVDQEMCSQLNPDGLQDHKEFLSTVPNFRSLLDKIAAQVRVMKKHILSLTKQHPEQVFYHHEAPDLFYARWKKLSVDFYNAETGMYDISKLPDLVDNIKYDLMHNVPAVDHSIIWELYQSASSFAAFVVSQEYGMSAHEKCSIGTKICRSLVRKLSWDMQVASGVLEHEGAQSTALSHRTLHRLSKECVTSIKNLKNPDRIIRSRFYFTSESHVVSLLNTLRHGFLQEGVEACVTVEAEQQLQNWVEYNYLTMITIRLFEDTESELALNDPERYFVEIRVSPGIHIQDDTAPGEDTSQSSTPVGSANDAGAPFEPSRFQWQPAFMVNSENHRLSSFLAFLKAKIPAVANPTDVLKHLPSPTLDNAGAPAESVKP